MNTSETRANPLASPLRVSTGWDALLQAVDEILADWASNDEMGRYDDALIENGLLQRLQLARQRVQGERP